MDESQNNFVEFQSQTIKSTYCMIPFIYNSRKCKLIYRDRKQISGGLGTGAGGSDYKGPQGNFWW